MRLETQLSKQSCPYCGETIQLIVDPSIDAQEYIEDCEVCCRPMLVMVESSSFSNDIAHICVLTMDQ